MASSRLSSLSSYGRHHHDSVGGTKTLTSRAATVLQVLAFLVAGLGFSVSFPLWVGEIVPNGSDSYFIWFVLSGFSAAFWGILVLLGLLFGQLSWKELTLPYRKAILAGCWYAQFGLGVYACDPTRTPQSLQPILGSIGIPFTLLIRQVLLGRHPVGNQRLGCVIILVGLAICLSPTLYSFSLSSDGTDSKTSGSIGALLWSVFMVFTTLGGSLSGVYCEEVLDNPSVSMIYYLFWMEGSHFIMVLLMFWTDMIPGFGYASGWDDFSTKFMRGFELMASGGDSMSLGVIVLASWALLDLLGSVLTRFSDGAAWCCLVGTLSLPIQTLLLSMLTVSKSGVALNIQFSTKVIVHLCGASLSVPGLVLYDHATRKGAKSCQDVPRSEASWSPCLDSSLHSLASLMAVDEPIKAASPV